MIRRQKPFKSAFFSRTISLFVLLALCISPISCSPSIALFSLVAYEMAIDLKVDGLRLMDAAELPFTDSVTKVKALQIRTEKAFEFAMGRPKNEHSAEQWRIMIDSDRHLLGGFFKRWESESTLSRAFIVEAKKLVEKSFDAIIGLESGKIGGTNDR